MFQNGATGGFKGVVCVYLFVFCLWVRVHGGLHSIACLALRPCVSVSMCRSANIHLKVVFGLALCKSLFNE